jgi:hypothetical protein
MICGVGLLSFGVGNAACASHPLSSDPTTDRVISISEVRSHNSGSSCWVVHDGIVYDVTDFIYHHPGGSEAILSAAGQNLEPFWEKFLVHSRRSLSLDTLHKYRIGRLSSDDALKCSIALHSSDRDHRNYSAITNRANAEWRGVKRTAFKSLSRMIASTLPVAVSGVGDAAPILPSDPDSPKPRVAIIGGGKFA